MTDKMNIWDNVCKTDPDATKQFNRGGGFKGTATNPTYLAKKATEMFGPYGDGWGMDLISSNFQEGHILDDAGNRAVVHIELWCLWYMREDKRCEVTHYGQTDFVGKNKNGAFTDEEAPKKTKTDAMTKCLAMLGFSADIHEGRYDDSKYVNDIRREFAVEKAPPFNSAESRTRLKDAMKGMTADSLDKFWKQSNVTSTIAQLSEPHRNEVIKAHTDRVGELA